MDIVGFTLLTGFVFFDELKGKLFDVDRLVPAGVLPMFGRVVHPDHNDFLFVFDVPASEASETAKISLLKEVEGLSRRGNVNRDGIRGGKLPKYFRITENP